MLVLVKLVSNGKQVQLEQDASFFKAKKRLSKNLQQVLNIPIFILGAILIVNQESTHISNSAITILVIIILIYSGKDNDRD